MMLLSRNRLPDFSMQGHDGMRILHARLLLVATFLALALAIMAVPVHAAVRYVKTDGNDSGDCSLRGTGCHTITYALSVAANGDDIKVASGSYTEAQITVNKAVTITGGFNANDPTQWNSSNYT